jgi:hypothetical protein
MDQDSRESLGIFSLAEWLWRLLSEPGGCGEGGGVYRTSGNTPPGRDLSGGVRRLLESYGIEFDERYVWD